MRRISVWFRAKGLRRVLVGGRASRTFSGMTMIEVVIGLAIVGLLVTPLAGALSLVLAQQPAQGNRLAVENAQGLARYWVTRDAASAKTYTAGTSPQYGTFTWSDYYGTTGAAYEVIYYYDPALKALMRTEKVNGVTQDTFYVADNIQQESDVAFAWSASQRKVTVTVTPTIADAPGVGTASRTGTLVAFLRYESEPLVSPPGTTPVPPPPPGSETYYLAATPTIVSGTYVSGNLASLHDADGSYYVVSAVLVSGSRTVAWTGSSETMPAPATINQVEVRFTGLVDRQQVTMQFFVADASGFPATADSGFTFTQADTTSTHSFLVLDPDTLAYINSTRVVSLKVVATASPSFTLSSDQVLFIASP